MSRTLFWTRLLNIMIALYFSDATQLRLVIDSSLANPAYYDAEALARAQHTLQDITNVVTPVDDNRWVTRNYDTDCTPAGYTRAVDLSVLMHGDILILLYTEDTPTDGSFCTGELAFARICLVEDSYLPVVALINVCPVDTPQLTGAQRQAELDYNTRIFLHEIIHAMGMVPRIMDTVSGVGLPNMYTYGIIAPSVVDWARIKYNCSYIQAVSTIGGHWDPFAVGQRELMTACLNEDAVLSPFTLLFLDSLGFYDMLVDRFANHYYVIGDSLDPWSGVDNETCAFAVFECGGSSSPIPSQLCDYMCVPQTQVVAVSMADALIQGTIANPTIIIADYTLTGDVVRQRPAAIAGIAGIAMVAFCLLTILR